jgi:hypothetical protein
VAALIDEAAARAGAWDGDVPFAESLALLLDSCGQTGRLNATGVTVLHRAAVRHLRNLRALDGYVDAHPDVATRPLPSPVVVTGMPRTGTTLAHNLLALDPAFRVLRLWEALQPVPADDGGGPSADALVARAGRWLDGFHRLVPGFRAIHAATPTGPEECDALLQNTFASQHFDDMFDAPEYSAWLATAPLTAEYAHYALQLRVLSGSSPPRSWALKSPSHLGHLDALLAALPGATIVVCHRAPQEAVASYASLVATLRRAYADPGSVSTTAIGAQALARTATTVARAMAVRDRTHETAFVDVSYRSLVDDPVGTLEGVYDRLGRTLDAATATRMREWTADNPRHRHGAHRYDLAAFGLQEADVDDRFRPYLERFGALAG